MMEVELYSTPNVLRPLIRIKELIMNYNDYKDQIFTNRPTVREEYYALGPQYEIIRAEIESRRSSGMTQKELAERMGTAQANISRFESGNYNPSLAFLQKMAQSLGKKLKITLE